MNDFEKSKQEIISKLENIIHDIILKNLQSPMQNMRPRDDIEEWINNIKITQENCIPEPGNLEDKLNCEFNKGVLNALEWVLNNEG